MKLNKLVLAGVSVVLAASLSFADDFDFGGGDFSFGGDGDSASESPVEIYGTVSADARAYISGDEKKASDVQMDGGAEAVAGIKYTGEHADADVKIKLNNSTVTEFHDAILDEASVSGYIGNFKLEAGKMKTVWGKGDKLHVIDNFNADDYTDFIIPDYVDRRIATPMVKGSYAFDYSGDVLSNVKIEGVYTPFLPVDRFASSGKWVPAQVSGLTSVVSDKAKADLAAKIRNLEAARLEAAEASTLKALYLSGDAAAGSVLTQAVTKAYTDGLISADAEKIMALVMAGKSQPEATQLVLSDAYASYVEKKLTDADTAYTIALNNASVLSGNSNIIYPETNSLEYGQAGARLTCSMGPVDLGLSYYYGHYKQPSVNALKIDSCLAKFLADEKITEADKFLAYDQKQTFGIEFASILWHFNVRGEGCYNLTEDTDGTNPWVHNNSVQWLGGFDIDLPFWNMNVNIQETGTCILSSDKIKDSPFEKADVDYGKNGYTNNKIVANITTSFKNDQILPEVTVLYGIENGDLVVMPKLVIKPSSELSLTASGLYLWNKNNDSEFAAWKNNNFVQLSASLTF